MDIRIGEVRALRAQNAKSSEIITQLKEVEASNRALLTSLERQLSDMRQANNSIIAENRKLESASAELTSKYETLKSQVSELTNLMKSKDAAFSAAKQQAHSLETDLEQLRAKYEQVQKEKASWKAKSQSNGSKEEEDLRVSVQSSLPSIMLMTPCSNSLSVLSAKIGLRILRSRHVVTCFASSASKIV